MEVAKKVQGVWKFRFLLWVALALAGAPPSRGLDAYLIFGAGPVNQSMGGAGTGVAVSPLGVILWNPALAGALEEGTLFDFGLEIVGADARVSSSVPIAPGVVSQGETRSKTEVFPPLPYFGLILPTSRADTTLHLGANPLFGFGVDYPAETRAPPEANLLLAPPPFGLGDVKSFHALERFSFGASRGLNERWSVGASAIAALGFLELEPAVFVPPDDANGDGLPSYPVADTETAWGAGFQVGVAYQSAGPFSAGLSFQSPIWMEDFDFQSRDEAGNRRDFSIGLDSPAIASVGLGYRLSEQTLLATDVRYIPFSETEGFEQSGFGPDGALRGLGLKDIWTYKLGLSHQLNDKTTVRTGYSYAQNAVPDRGTFFGVPAPVIAEHHLAAGFSRDLSDTLTFHVTTWYALENSQTGPILSPSNEAIPGATVTNSVEAYSLSFGFTLKL